MDEDALAAMLRRDGGPDPIADAGPTTAAESAAPVPAGEAGKRPTMPVLAVGDVVDQDVR